MGVASVPGSVVGAVNRPSLSTTTTTAPKAAATGVAASSPQDQVSLSPLAKSLHDESLTVFNALSDDQRGQLSALVDSGQLSGEDVHNALKQRLKEARRNAFASMGRMFSNDTAEIRLKGATSGQIDGALRTMLERRSGMVNSLTEMERNGERGSQAYKDLSTQLQARDMNPVLNRLAPGSGITRHFTMDFEDSRLMSTHKEGDAVYKLKATSFNLGDLDRAIRPIGERDATALVNEQSFGAESRVSKDRAFSLDDAIIKPIFSGQPDQTTSSFIRDAFRPPEIEELIPTNTPGIYEIKFKPNPDQDKPSLRELLSKSMPTPSTPAQLEERRNYLTGLFAKYT
ncbi:hypothetical protein D3877_17310 [Azospirillum cavernae]|uniref:Uncharacterized protein n=1 Tax=Azospirillum cavernae TaxID=2320860 RepID=A0A418VXG9_9PROT|nr:hypothetical protein [Azospirillum cavernae]RJF81859.1 hypothetical protein D3877_17310 [Azospirillum cavernae]